jgi:hypothetical protein
MDEEDQGWCRWRVWNQAGGARGRDEPHADVGPSAGAELEGCLCLAVVAARVDAATKHMGAA